MNDIVVLFYFYCCRSESKRHVSCLFINIADFDKVPCEKLQEKSSFTLPEISRDISSCNEKVKDEPWNVSV